MPRYNIIRNEPQWRRERRTAFVDSGALSPVEPRQRLSEQKALSPRGCRMWAHTVKCLTSCQGFSATTRCSTCQITPDSAPVLSPCQIPRFPCPLPPTPANPSPLWKCPLWKARRPKTHSDLLPRRETSISRLLKKATLAGIMLSYPAKNPINLGAALSEPHGADRVGAAHK